MKVTRKLFVPIIKTCAQFILPPQEKRRYKLTSYWPCLSSPSSAKVYTNILPTTAIELWSLSSLCWFSHAVNTTTVSNKHARHAPRITNAMAKVFYTPYFDNWLCITNSP